MSEVSASALPDATAGNRAQAVRCAPSWPRRLYAVWYRHFRVYSNFFLPNAVPAIFEPVLMLTAVGLGVGHYIDRTFNHGLSYVQFMSPGILAMASAYTAAFEASYGTFIRYNYQKTYTGMIATPLTRRDIFAGELLWCATKGAFFATLVAVVLWIFGVVKTPWTLPLVPVAGFFNAMLFAGLSFTVTSFVKSINHFQYYFTAVLTPLTFFSGMMFPVQDLPANLEALAYALPMFHTIETFRLLISGPPHASVTWVWACPLALAAVAVGLGALGVWRMEGKMKA